MTLFTRHYFTGQIILEIILTIRNMEMYYRKPGSLAKNNINCIGFYWYKFNKLLKCYEMLKSIFFCAWLFFSPFFCCRRVPLSLKSTIKKRYAEEISQWITFRTYLQVMIKLVRELIIDVGWHFKFRPRTIPLGTTRCHSTKVVTIWFKFLSWEISHVTQLT